MQIHFTCPHCGQLLSVTRRKVGEAVQCVRCKGGVLVPDAPDDAANTPAQTATESITEEYQPSTATQNVAASEPGTRKNPDTLSRPLHISRTAFYSIGGLIVGTAIVAFLLGWTMGRETRFHESPAVGGGTWHRVSGRISFLTQRGKSAADAESVVVALPANRKPDEKFDSSVLRPEIAPNNVPTPLLQAIRAFGGGYTRVDRNGTYDLELPSAGEYYILVISNHATRPASRQPSTPEIVEMGRFFTRASELIAKNDFIWSKRLVKRTLSVNHVFGAAE